MHTYIHIYTYIYLYRRASPFKSTSIGSEDQNARAHKHIQICENIRIHTFIYMYTHTYIYTDPQVQGVFRCKCRQFCCDQPQGNVHHHWSRKRGGLVHKCGVCVCARARVCVCVCVCMCVCESRKRRGPVHNCSVYACMFVSLSLPYFVF